jgi:DNA-directed RNA polymerase subunit M/transcription elongation factor TFIIS
LIEFCQECGDVIDEVRAIKGKKTCTTCQRKIYNRKYYSKNKNTLIAQNAENRKLREEKKKEIQAKREMNAEYQRKYRARIKAGSVGTGSSLMSPDVVSQMLKDLYVCVL